MLFLRGNRQTSSSLLLSFILLANLSLPVHTEKSSDGEPRLIKVAQDALKDFSDTIANSTQPFADLQTKYGPAVTKFGLGAATGYVVGYAVKRLAISIIKAVSVGAAALAVSIMFGWAGKDQSARVLEKLKAEAKHAEDAVISILDFNGDGLIDQDDLRELARRAERVVLRSNLPFTLGAVVGGSAGIVSATLNPLN